MDTPHIVLISLHADPSTPQGAHEGGGTHSYLRELLAGFALKGRRCTLITRRTSPQLVEVEKITEDIKVVRIQSGPLRPIDKKKLNQYHEQSLRQIRRIIESLSDSRVVLHSVYWNSGRVAMNLSEEFGVPYVHTVISNGLRREREGAPPNAPHRIDIERRIFTKAALIFCVSEEERKDLIELYEVAPKRLVVIGRPVGSVFRLPARDDMGIPRPINLSQLTQ